MLLIDVIGLSAMKSNRLYIAGSSQGCGQEANYKFCQSRLISALFIFQINEVFLEYFIVSASVMS